MTPIVCKLNMEITKSDCLNKHIDKLFDELGHYGQYFLNSCLLVLFEQSDFGRD